MPNPFLYPKVRHRRTLVPPVRAHYRFYKEDLRQEFSEQCVYCRALDSVKGVEAFGVDHYRPKQHFPALANEYMNLYYSCNRCNSWKGSYWPNPTEYRKGRFVPNPCEHVMFEHVRYRGGCVISASLTGQWTIDKLDLNDPAAVSFREAFIHLLKRLDDDIAKSRRTVRQAQKKHSRAAAAGEERAAAELFRRAEKNLSRLVARREAILGH